MQKIIGIGIDICKIERISKILGKGYKENFLRKVLNENERIRSEQAEFVSGRWAAKEALVKALGMRNLIFSEIEINYHSTGQPCFIFHSITKEILCKKSFFLSISHENEFTVAVVIALNNE